MSRVRRVLSIGAACLLCAAGTAYAAEEGGQTGLARVYGSDGRMLVVEIEEEAEDGGIVGFDLAAGEKVTLAGESVAAVRRDVKLQAAVDWAGFAPVAAWLLRRRPPAADGAVVSVTDAGVYINLGVAAGLSAGEGLTVVRPAEADEDALREAPVQGEPTVVAELEAVDVQEKLTICRRTDDGDLEVSRGDPVVRGRVPRGLLVLPFSFADDHLAGTADAARAVMIAQLSQTGIVVADPDAVADAVAAAGLVPGAACTSEQAEQIGSSLGAQGVVFGTVSGSRAGAVLDARLAMCRTGEVILAAREKLRTGARRPASPQGVTIAVAALVAGASDLVISGGELYWRQRSGAVPGTDPVVPGVVRPTYTNGRAWQPQWEGAVSDRFGLPGAIPTDPARLTAQVLPVQARSRPTARIEGRDVVIALNDRGAGSSAYRLQIWIGESDAPGATVLAAQQPVRERSVARRPDQGQSPEERLAERVRRALMQPVTLKAPYPKPYPEAPERKISVQYAVQNILEQVGLQYSWDESQEEVGSARRRWISPRFYDMPCQEALERILRPLHLVYEIHGDTIFLKHRLSTRKRVTQLEDQ